MTYVTGFLTPVKTEDKARYVKSAEASWPLFQKYGALSQVETWGEDVPDGTLTSFPMAVKLQEGEVVVIAVRQEDPVAAQERGRLEERRGDDDEHRRQDLGGGERAPERVLDEARGRRREDHLDAAREQLIDALQDAGAPHRAPVVTAQDPPGGRQDGTVGGQLGGWLDGRRGPRALLLEAGNALHVVVVLGDLSNSSSCML